MKLGKRTVYALLLGLICLSLFVRLPTDGHEAGADSFFIHSLATDIIERGHAPWILNPLGYFGWYPLSYPSAGPMLIAGYTAASGLTSEGAILVLSLLYGVLGVLAAFLMARSFREDDAFALVVAFIFSLAPRFITFTQWSASTRNLFMVLVPIFLWSFVRAYRRPTATHVFVMITVLMVMLATHRLTILLAVVVLAFVVAYVFILLHRVLRFRFPSKLLAPAFRRWTPRLALLGILGIAAFMLFGTEVLEEYAQGELCSGMSTEAKLCNLGVSITRSVGLALPFALGGVFVLVRENNKGFIEAFLILSLLALIPTLFLRQYTGFYILPFVAIFAGFGIVGLARATQKRPRMRNALVAATLVVMSGISFAILDIEAERGTAMTDPNYTTALYVKYLPEGNLVANDGLLGVRVFSVSGRHGLPIGGAGTISQSAELLVMGVYNASEVYDRERRISLTELTIEDDSPFIVIGVNAREDWVLRVLERDVNDVSIADAYSLQYYLERDDLRNQFTAFGRIYTGSTFASTVHQGRFKVYDGSTEDLYLAFPPLQS